jgi:hypothetical protein
MPQQDERAAELNHAREIEGIALPSSVDAAEVLQPGEQALDLPMPNAAAAVDPTPHSVEHIPIESHSN